MASSNEDMVSLDSKTASKIQKVLNAFPSAAKTKKEEMKLPRWVIERTKSWMKLAQQKTLSQEELLNVAHSGMFNSNITEDDDEEWFEPEEFENNKSGDTNKKKKVDIEINVPDFDQESFEAYQKKELQASVGPLADLYWGMMKSMMPLIQNMLTKEIMYPCIEATTEAYPIWLDQNESALLPVSYQRYWTQYCYYKKAKEIYDEQNEKSSEKDIEKIRIKIQWLTAEIEKMGKRPEEIVRLQESMLPQGYNAGGMGAQNQTNQMGAGPGSNGQTNNVGNAQDMGAFMSAFSDFGLGGDKDGDKDGDNAEECAIM